MDKIRYNKSKTYLLPLISEFVNIKKEYFYNLENTYIFDDKRLYNNSIYLLHNFSFKNPKLTSYEHELTDNHLFTDIIDDPSNNKVIYVFKFPEEYMDEYNKYKEGKYSEFNKDAKEIILNFYGNIYSNNNRAVSFLLKAKQILFKDKILREKYEKELNVKIDSNAELSDPMNEEDETILLSKIIDNQVMNNKIRNGKYI
jgi:hypothetical protein